jgi:hypothetical protein
MCIIIYICTMFVKYLLYNYIRNEFFPHESTRRCPHVVSFLPRHVQRDDQQDDAIGDVDLDVYSALFLGLFVSLQAKGSLPSFGMRKTLCGAGNRINGADLHPAQHGASIK